MRIGIVLAAVPGYSETFFRSKIKGLKEHGFEVLLFANGPKGAFDLCPYIKGSKGEKSAKELFYTFSSLTQLLLSHPLRMFRFLKAERKSGRSWKSAISNLIFSTHILLQQLDWLHFGFGTMALGKENVAKSMGAKIALSLRGFDIAIYPLKHPGCYKLLWTRLDKLHVISDDLKTLAMQQGILPQTKVCKITPAIDVNQFQNQKPMNQTWHSSIQILTVARLNWKKGLEYSLQAMAILRKHGISFSYTIIGEGEEYERLVFAAHQLGIRERVQFAGAKRPEEVKQAMQECDLYLQYSISEGFCNAVLEAQAMGCLCVVSDAEGLAENVLDGETGWVVAKRNPALLAKTIQTVMTLSKKEVRTIQLRASQRVKKEFNIQKQQKEFISFYKE